MQNINIHRKFISLCDNGFALVDIGGGIIEVNNALCELTGRSRDDLIGAGIDILFDNFSVQKILCIYESYSCCDISHTISGDLLYKNGLPRSAEIYINCNDEEYWLLVKNKSFRKEMEKKLRQSELMLSTTLESLPFDFWINDAENHTYMQNSYSKALWGDVKGKRPDEVIDAPDIVDKWMETTERALKGEVVNDEITYFVDGKKKNFRNIVAPIRDEDNILGVLGMNIDITDLKDALNIRDMLLKEVHHRVKNNLQMIISIINLESLGFSNNDGRAVFDDLISRIEAISLVHAKLYTTDINNMVHSAGYIRDLVDHILSGVNSENVIVDYDLNDIILEVDRVIILGLLINEMVTNSAKYAFIGEGRHVLGVSLKRQNPDIVAEVSDNGPGLPDSCEDVAEKSLGFRMMDALTAQLEGRLVRSSSKNGCITRLFFPEKKAEISGISA